MTYWIYTWQKWNRPDLSNRHGLTKSNVLSKLRKKKKNKNNTLPDEEVVETTKTDDNDMDDDDDDDDDDRRIAPTVGVMASMEGCHDDENNHYSNGIDQ